MSTRSAELFEQAKKVLAGGVSRNILLRAPHPFYGDRASGCRITDVEGVERLDFTNNMASLIHGHGHPAVIEAVHRQLERATAFTMATEAEIRYAEHIVGRSPGFDKVRFVNSGTEAVMAAIKAARAHTGRPRFAKVEGTYHGAYDFAEVSQAPHPGNWGHEDRPTSVPNALGTPTSVLRDVVIIPFNKPEAAVAILDDHKDELACVLLDPMPHRAGLVPSSEAFVQAMRDWTRANGALLVFDEVITFRTEVGGMQLRYGPRPDLTSMGKILGGGFPVGAVAGSDEAMSVFVPGSEGPRLPQSGTFSANPITMTAGRVAMELYDADAVERLNALGDLARETVREAIAAAGAPATVTGAGSMFRIHFKHVAPTDYRSAFYGEDEKRAKEAFISSVYDHGVMLANTGTGILSTPMGEAEIGMLGEAVLGALNHIKR